MLDIELQTDDTLVLSRFCLEISRIAVFCVPSWTDLCLQGLARNPQLDQATLNMCREGKTIYNK